MPHKPQACRASVGGVALLLAFLIAFVHAIDHYGCDVGRRVGIENVVALLAEDEAILLIGIERLEVALQRVTHDAVVLVLQL